MYPARAQPRAAADRGITFFDDARYNDETGTAPLASGYSEVLFGELEAAERGGQVRAPSRPGATLVEDDGPGRSSDISDNSHQIGLRRFLPTADTRADRENTAHQPYSLPASGSPG